MAVSERSAACIIGLFHLLQPPREGVALPSAAPPRTGGSRADITLSRDDKTVAFAPTSEGEEGRGESESKTSDEIKREVGSTEARDSWRRLERKTNA